MRINSNWIAACAALLLTPSASALEIFACEPEYAALLTELAPEAEVYSATTALQDPHHVQARPSLIAKMRKADLAVCAGAALEVGWLPVLQMKANNRKLRDGQPGMFYAADQVETLDQLTQVDRTMGDVHPEGNPHLHFSPYRMLTIAQALAQRLGEIDPANKASYQANLAAFEQRWTEATAKWEAKAAPLRGQGVIAYHTAFRYLFDWLGIEQRGDLEPKPGLPPTSAHLASLVELANSGQVKAVIHTRFQDPRGANWLAQRSELPVLALPYSTGSEGIDNLYQLYDQVIDALLAELTS
ncbi:metal ABC transporter solute-binding protein, Zn/Mn family [Ferrimonas marina]|uniref:metal ABC transporter solute-binding protein, Zn/Mn family n=1 Tax=Ferrimonas marina TaxID=299255 RepID=UPI0008297C07|nr:zinc ABC transporter substrate-binding protein [Ferrimonas marina]